MSNYGSERSPLELPRQDVLPASQYLQERLMERRSRNTRPKRSRHTDFGPQPGRDDDIFLNEAETHLQTRRYDSSPVAMSARGSDAGGHSGNINRRRVLGVKDMDDQLDRLNKQNFALKLEIDHRRDHTQKLQEQLNAMREQVERAEKMEEEHAELLRINTQLVEELEKRDKAVEEAMDIVCDLEERVSDLEETTSNTRPSTAHADSGYAGTELHESDSPKSQKEANSQPKTPQITVRQPSLPASVASQKLQGLLNGQTPARLKREPNILSQQEPSTRALRSVYLENARELHPVKSFHSFLSRQEKSLDDEAEDALNSPRLSLLSESSFPSIYSPKEKPSPDHFAWENAVEDEHQESPARPRSHARNDSIKRVSQWISEHDMAKGTPSKSNSISKPLQESLGDSMPPPRLTRLDAPATHYQSLNDALTAASAKPADTNSDKLVSSEPRTRLKRRPQTGRTRLTSFIGPSYGEPLLPPTPDSVSTRMLRNSRSSINDHRSLLDTTPAAVKGFDALEPGVRTAPRQMRSSVELRTAYSSNLQHRHEAPQVPDFNEISDDEEFGYADQLSERALDFGPEYDCPDGKSIMMGTPSRFLKGSQPPAFFDGTSISPPQHDWSPLRRRQSSENMTSSAPAKPRLTRVETSPTIFGTLGRMVSGGGKASTSVETVTSPRSANSESSGNRTVVPGCQQHQSRSHSPEAMQERSRFHSSVTSPTRSRTSPSPARTFGRIFRRMSNSQGSEREKSPLPTLTSTHSSAYADNIPIEIRRPMTSHGHERASRNGAATPVAIHPPAMREFQRPTLSSRTKTEPGTPRPPSSAGQNGAEKEKRSLFKRSNSVKNTPEQPPAGTETRRRGSIRDVVSTARRPWR